MSSTLLRLRRAAAGTALVLMATSLPTGVAGAAATDGVTSPPVTELSTGPVADWGTSVGTGGRVYIADANGRALTLHGFNDKTHDPSASLTDAKLAAAVERGLDHYRMTIYWQFLEPTEDNYDEAYLDNVVTAIRRAEKHGIRVILDMHQDVYGEAFGSTGAPTWATESDGLAYEPQESWLLDYMQPGVQRAFENLYEDPRLRQAQIDVWMHVVNRVKDEPGLLGYDLMNEPFGEIREGENLISAAARVEREQITPMYQRLTDAIAAVDSDHWVFIEPPNLASLGIPTSMGPVHGPKVAFYPHMYDTSLETSTYNPDSDQYTYNPDFFESWAAAITTYTDTNPMPMLIGEWGVARPEAHSMDAFVRETLSTLDAVSSGWSHFSFCFGGGYCSVDAEGHDRPNISQIFVPYARAIAGAPTSSTYDFDSRTLRVVYRDNTASGPTEIFVPESRSYPGGFKIITSDGTAGSTQHFDEATGVVSVSIDKTSGDHAICVVPADSEMTVCPTNTTTDGDGDGESPSPSDATPASPVAVRPDYTG